MINTDGVLAVMDHHVTINWDDGPTLHKLTAQVRYHTTEVATSKTLRVNASQRYSDDPLSFMVMGDGLRASWIWQERGPGWTAQLAVLNEGEDDVYLDALDVIRIDFAFGGLFNLGAPPGLWQVAMEDVRGLLAAPGTASGEPLDASSAPASGAGDVGNADERWEAWSPATTTAAGFVRRRQFIVQPTVSNRTRPPAVLIQVLDSAPHDAPTEIRMEANGERFERLVARCRTDGMLLGAGVSVASPEFWVVSGDDVEELKRLEMKDER